MAFNKIEATYMIERSKSSAKNLSIALKAFMISALFCTKSALALSGGSYTPPGGQLPATAPGGTQGLAGPRNVDDAVRGGHVYGAQREYGERRFNNRKRNKSKRAD